MKLSDLTQEDDDLIRQCRVCAVLRAMEAKGDPRRALLIDVLGNSKVPYTMIAESLQDEGFPGVTGGTVGKHVNGKCKARIRYR